MSATPQGTYQLPPQLSTIAPEVDWVYYFIYWISVAFFVVITAVMIWYVIRYRRRPGVRAIPTGHNTPLEVFWTVTPLILLFLLFDWGFKGYMHGLVAPPDSLEIRVRGMQWQWEFEHPNGIVEVGELKVPVNRPVKLIMSSEDVIHSFFIPEFRQKRDVVPGMYSTLWFEATHTGKVQVYCTEYCGAPAGSKGNAGHSNMLAMVNVMTQREYDKFLEQGPPMPSECEKQPNPAACWGERLYSDYGCKNCHSVDGVQQQPAPNWKGLFGKTEQLANGERYQVDENYIRESILQPQAKITAGYTSVVMPPYRMSDKQLDGIIAYMKSLQ